MSDLLIYLIKANVAIALFAVLYQGIFRKLTFYALNRFYLLFALVFSVLYPFIPIEHWMVSNTPVSSQPLTTIAVNWDRLAAQPAWQLDELVAALFWTISGIFLTLLVLRFWAIGRIHVKSHAAFWHIFPYRRVQEAIMPYSFFTYIYVNPSQHTDNELVDVFKHESVHVRQWHSVDNLLAQLTLVFFWFNPFCWYMRRAICLNLEYIADQCILKSGVDRQRYQFSLLKTGARPQTGIVNHFNFKNLKNRITMMNRKKSSPLQLGIYVFFMPALVVCTLLFGFTKEHTNKKAAVSLQDTLQQDTTSRLLIRGAGKDPLYILGNKEIDPADMQTINPNTIQRVVVLKDSAATQKYGKKGKNGVVLIELKKEPAPVQQIDSTATKTKVGVPDMKRIKEIGEIGENGADPLVFIDGKEASYMQMKAMDPSDIQSITILKEKAAIEQYGSKAKDGVILVITKAGASEK